MTCRLCLSLEDVFPEIAKGHLSASTQGFRQAISLGVTLGIALLGGIVVGKSSDKSHHSNRNRT